MNANRVTLECTPTDYTWTVWNGKKKVAEHKMVLNRYGATGVGKGDINDKLPDFPELAEAIDGFGNGYDVSKVLNRLNGVELPEGR